MKTIDYTDGFSLIELLLASVLALFLLSMLVGLYLSDKANYRYIQALQTLTDQGRLALYLLRYDIGRAGFIGCVKISDVEIENTLLTPNFSSHQFIFGYSNNHYDINLPTDLNRRILPDTDALLIEEAGPLGVNLLTVKNDNKTILSTATTEFSVGNKIIISDCEQAEIFTITSLRRANNTINIELDHVIDKPFSKNAEIYPLNAIIYFIADTGRHSNTGYPIHALYRKELYNGGKMPVEMIDGVSQLKIFYDALNRKDNTMYENQTAAEVTQNDNWTNVIGIRIALLLNSLHSIDADNKQYYFLGKLYQAKDKRIYKEMETYIAVQSNPN